MYGTTIYGMIRNGIVWNVIALIATPKTLDFLLLGKRMTIVTFVGDPLGLGQLGLFPTP